jgi:hypothetical protein
MQWCKTALVLAFLTVPSHGGVQQDCDHSDKPSVVVFACSQLLQSGSLSKRRKSEVLVSRAIAYYNKRDYASALKDSDQAVELTQLDMPHTTFAPSRVHSWARNWKHCEILSVPRLEDAVSCKS